MKKKYDVCAIGNALVDYEIEVEEQFFIDHKIEKGIMTLVDKKRQKILLNSIIGKIKKKQGGGSAANTIFGLAKFGGKGYYTCKVANDADGILYYNDLVKAGIDSNLNPENLHEGTTGNCLVMISPDAERTMNSYLGITSDFSSNDLNKEAIKSAQYLFMEGFLVSSPNGLDAMKKAKNLAKENNVKISLTFSDPSMVKYFNNQMKEVVGNGIDLLFCNITEAELFTGAKGIEMVKDSISKIAKEFVITKGKDGALIFDGTTYYEIAPFHTKAIDVTGAGDMFAGAYLYGINNNLSPAQSGRLASAASSAIVSKYGPRLNNNSIKDILSKINN